MWKEVDASDVVLKRATSLAPSLNEARQYDVHTEILLL
jgi:hypothetical protein